MQTWLDIAIPLVKRWEGCELKAYPDPGSGGDPWTIGYGHTGPDVTPGVRWTQAQADAALRSDLGRFGATVDALVLVHLEPREMAALVSLTYNIGPANFKKSTLLRLLNQGAKTLAAREFPRWNRASGKIMRGLTNRRAAERALFLGIKE